MVTPSAGSVVLVTFPFSDLSAARLRPAVALAGVGRDDRILCQVTSNAYSDPAAVELTNTDFAWGSLQRLSFARPGRLFNGERIAHAWRGRAAFASQPRKDSSDSIGPLGAVRERATNNDLQLTYDSAGASHTGAASRIR